MRGGKRIEAEQRSLIFAQALDRLRILRLPGGAELIIGAVGLRQRRRLQYLVESSSSFRPCTDFGILSSTLPALWNQQVCSSVPGYTSRSAAQNEDYIE